LEWIQQAIPGRTPDITDVLIAITGWTLPLLFINFKSHEIQGAVCE
jgi:hypothetical protein